MSPKRPKRPIDWDRVEAAMRRGKMGRMQLGDQDIVDEALKADFEEYRRRKRLVDADVIRKEKGRWK